MRIAICDDEQYICNTIEKFLSTYTPAYDITSNVFYDGEDLLCYCIEHNVFDVAFLDIEMPTLNGIEVAKRLLQINEKCIIIFITSHATYISDAFRLAAFQFLLKPINPDDFHQDFKRAIQRYNNLHAKYVVKWRDKITCLVHKDILFIEVNRKHLFIYTKTQIYECTGKITDEEARLYNFGFVRCHQSYLVNLLHIKTIEKDFVVLADGSEVRMSRQMRNKVFDAFLRQNTGPST